jgi:NAD(P)-dependent dehydrogenase (short-subunit alcohol dehydrogenase family)
MQDLRDRVAVITGAGSGFGRELALCCAEEGMHLVLADIDETGLKATQALLDIEADRVLAQRCNVADAAEVEALADATWNRFGAAHLVFNNAGVAVAGPIWSATPEDWRWVLDVNVMGVVHGVRSFVPRMLAQGGPGHVVNTASVAGLLSVPASGVYCVSKHAVVTMSEVLHHDLRAENAEIGVSVLCPAYVPTGIADAARNRPADLAASNPLAAEYEARVRKAVASGRISAADVARMTMDAVKAGDFYILTHPKIKVAIEARMRDILDQRLPTNPMP